MPGDLFSDQAKSSRYPSRSEVEAVLSGKKVNGIHSKSYRNEVSIEPLATGSSRFDWRKMRKKADGSLVLAGKRMAWIFSVLFILAGLVIGGVVLSNQRRAMNSLVPVFMMSIAGSAMAYAYQATVSFDVDNNLVAAGGSKVWLTIAVFALIAFMMGRQIVKVEERAAADQKKMSVGQKIFNLAAAFLFLFSGRSIITALLGTNIAKGWLSFLLTRYKLFR